MDHQSKIYVAGHRGMVGSAILRRLTAKGFRRIITRTRAELDLENQENVAEFFEQERPEYVFLAAAKVGGIHANNSYPADFIYKNLSIQTNVLHQSYACGVKKLIFLGSSCIYPRKAPQPMKETYLLAGPLEPTNAPYAVAKIAGIQMCWAYNRQHGTQFIPVMPTNLYGPRDSFDLETSHVFPALIRKLHLAKLAGKGDDQSILRDENRFGPIPQKIRALLASGTEEIPIWGTGEPRREFLHVDDLADACHLLMDLPFERIVTVCSDEGKAGDILFNVGHGADLSIKELAVKIRAIIEADASFIFDDSRPDGTMRKLLDVSRMERLDWRAGIDLATGIRETYQWYLQQTDGTR